MDYTFLYREYEECFKQLRFYDERQVGLVNYILTLSSTAATVIFGLYKLFEKDMSKFFLAQSVLSLIIYVSIIVIIAGMVQNRIYFTFAAKQINAIRKHFLENEASYFKENQMYTSTSFSAFKFLSIQTLMIFGVLTISIIFWSSFIFSFCEVLDLSNSLVKAISLSIILMGIKVLTIMLYLKTKGKSSADRAIHGE